MTDTPRTNTLLIAYEMSLKPDTILDHACKLERELNDAKQHIEELKRAGNELAAWVESIYQMNHLLSLEQYKQIKLDLKEWEKAIQ